ncbi:hypothetical protein N657DRAFT_25182 [Parathielavia appendiculata]|uniref:Uncharacterized protein n=1 Tax=Parathielavia appendiculata TaxID=2587402 RepID=A0AAN6U9P9_9PEZI|nr:hypothetical protein N657DRAFT_25182 [Parathielavia appendiculata]
MLNCYSFLLGGIFLANQETTNCLSSPSQPAWSGSPSKTPGIKASTQHSSSASLPSDLKTFHTALADSLNQTRKTFTELGSAERRSTWFSTLRPTRDNLDYILAQWAVLKIAFVATTVAAGTHTATQSIIIASWGEWSSERTQAVLHAAIPRSTTLFMFFPILRIHKWTVYQW